MEEKQGESLEQWQPILSSIHPKESERDCVKIMNRANIKSPEGKSVLDKRMLTNEIPKDILQRIGTIKKTISEIRLECEELRTIIQRDTVKCSVCGKDIQTNQGALFKGSIETRVLCKKCFQEMFK